MNERNVDDILRESVNDLHDRADVCPADSEDYLKLKKQEAEDAKIVLEEERNKREQELEFKRIELEMAKIKNSMDWKDPKFLLQLFVQTFVPSIVTLAVCGIQARSLREHRRETMKFEEDGHTWTTQASRANSNAFKFSIGGNKGLM